MRSAIVLTLALIAACTQMPALDGRIDAAAREAPYPALLPLGPLLARASGGSRTVGSPDLSADLPRRLAGLERRARALRGPVMTAAERARLLAGIDIGALQ